jgi:hypothetical protein
MSRRNKSKLSRNYQSSKAGTKIGMHNHQHSRRSNSVSTNRNKRSSSSHRRSSKTVIRRFHRSNSHLRGLKYIKNILPIVSQDDTRAMISNNFDSGQNI